MLVGGLFGVCVWTMVLFLFFVCCFSGLIVDYLPGLSQIVRYLTGRVVCLCCVYWLCLCCFCGTVFDLT